MPGIPPSFFMPHLLDGKAGFDASDMQVVITKGVFEVTPFPAGPEGELNHRSVDCIVKGEISAPYVQ